MELHEISYPALDFLAVLSDTTLDEIQTSVKTRYFVNIPPKLNAPRICPHEGDEIQRSPC